MQFEPTPIPGAFVIRLSPFIDERGAFSRLFCENELAEIGYKQRIVQINHSINKEKGTLRGLHFQRPPHAEIKIIRCLHGRVFDVMVDLRKGSPTFSQWYGVELSPEAYNMICIPMGCAHGFQTLEENSELLYFHTAFYNKEYDGGVRFDDPQFSIHWPLPPVNVSEKDKSYALLDDAFGGIMPFD
ncbi:MAG TPA: dTDP-4-dehydrorhamnose 3,5-epimerase [Puia sp.]|nr:dTDP-4-dehydrorhamnose 3,5-epimerase [Puia sp.]